MESLDPSVERELTELILASDERDLTEAEMRRLAELLDDSPAACRFLAELTWQRQEVASLGTKPMPAEDVAELIGEHAGADEAAVRPGAGAQLVDRAEVASGMTRATGYNGFLGGALVGALAASLALLAWLPERIINDGAAIVTPPPIAKASPAAVVTATTACVWQGPEEQTLKVGDVVTSGREIELIEGIAEVRLGDSGEASTLLRIEGPASVVFKIGGLPVLRYGKMIIDNTHSESEVTIGTSIGKVGVDHRTMVGLASFNAKATIHVFRGKASFSKPRYATDPSEAYEFSSGQSGFVLSNANGTKVDIGKANPNLFAAARSMGLDVLPAPGRYLKSVLRSEPFAYWRFEEVVDGFFRNEVSDDFHCRATGPVRLVGPPQNHSVEFVAKDDETMLYVDQVFDEAIDTDYSIECWVKPSHYHRGTMFALVTPNEEARYPMKRVLHSVFLELYAMDSSPTTLAHPGRVRFLHRSPPARWRELGTSCFSKSPYRLRRWQHMVATKRGAEMRLYVNGALAGVTADPSPLPDGLRLLIGRQEFEGWAKPFIGQLDELAVYDRALSQSEVQEHYESIRVRSTQPDMI